MENNTQNEPHDLGSINPTSSPINGNKPLINKRLRFIKKYGIIGAFALIGAVIGFFFWQSQQSITPLTLPKTDATADSLLVMGKRVSVANVQVSYTKAFKHLKRMDVYYREARDLLLDFQYAEVVKKCDSALLHKTEKPLNWTAQKWGDVYNLKAESLLYLGDLANAEAAAINALKMDKQDKFGYLHLIYAQILADKYKKVTPLFLENFKYALKKQLPLQDYMELPGFDAVKKDPSVKKLLR
jgi:tetratricopeptide (TPR) repeat protein